MKALLGSFCLAAAVAAMLVVTMPTRVPAQASLFPSGGAETFSRFALATPTGRTNITAEAVARINAMSRRPVPFAPAPVVRPDMLWVPDRYVRAPGAPDPVLVPGHWERRLSDREVYVPPIVIAHPAGGSELFPAGVRLPAAERVGP